MAYHINTAGLIDTCRFGSKHCAEGFSEARHARDVGSAAKLRARLLKASKGSRSSKTAAKAAR